MGSPIEQLKRDDILFWAAVVAAGALTGYAVLRLAAASLGVTAGMTGASRGPSPCRCRETNGAGRPPIRPQSMPKGVTIDDDGNVTVSVDPVDPPEPFGNAAKVDKL